MNINSEPFLLLSMLFLLISCSSPGGDKDREVLITTSEGNIKIRLYDSTPLHRDNFIRLASSGFYDGIAFHRVINEFMIQAGDPLTKTGSLNEQSDTINSYTIPAEFRKELFHKKGAVAAARQGNNVNPEMRSSGTQFYIVQGKKYSSEDLSAIEKSIDSGIKQNIFSRLLKEVSDSVRLSGQPVADGVIQEIVSEKMFRHMSKEGDFRFSQEQKAIYETAGGTPFLDGTYTVFGEVIEGLDIVDKIAVTKTGPGDKPVSDIKIFKMKVIN
ncbi:MAG: peptidylprolyl isomerase [Bacteroidales bacterium]|jgi:peptidylprolyl isomerase/peptidyl-prolyl cis-trans isomerase B (cyclophilin B)|nr:peptidylprolyl isomerase [Bacteroidales bacterium]